MPERGPLLGEERFAGRSWNERAQMVTRGLSEESSAPVANVRLGQELVRSKMATLRQVRECLAFQSQLRTEGRDTPLGGLMVSRGIIKIEGLKEVLSRLGLLTLMCPRCFVQIEVAGYHRNNEYMCNRCSEELVYASSRPTRQSTLLDA